MEFWGLEVKNGASVKVEPGDDKILHVSQASLGEVKKEKGSDPVYLYLKVKNQKFVLATLSHEKFPQVNLDVVFHEEFELSHSFKSGSVYFTGYKVEAPEGSESDYDSEEDQEIPQLTIENVKVESKAIKAEPGAEKPSAAKSDNAKKHVNFKEPPKDAKPKKEEDDSDDDDSSSEESSDEEKLVFFFILCIEYVTCLYVYWEWNLPFIFFLVKLRIDSVRIDI
ncbi:histone deacetylase HDT2-like [Carica papaya]|uniref:histone deacetylase HDT2-like n=1 Tax=Carica papaya TaxID=3649 RepID=UPI000B8CA51B|nr:histone deacetylase HDT2-like [Carica papaya]